MRRNYNRVGILVLECRLGLGLEGGRLWSWKTKVDGRRLKRRHIEEGCFSKQPSTTMIFYLTFAPSFSIPFYVLVFSPVPFLLVPPLLSLSSICIISSISFGHHHHHPSHLFRLFRVLLVAIQPRGFLLKFHFIFSVLRCGFFSFSF
jgi:hypothetical protein